MLGWQTFALNTLYGKLYTDFLKGGGCKGFLKTAGIGALKFDKAKMPAPPEAAAEAYLAEW